MLEDCHNLIEGNYMSDFAYLIQEFAEKDNKTWNINREQFVIGRGTTAHLQIDLPQISREHAMIEIKGLEYYIRDLDSHNGTFANGQKITDDPKVLNDGDCIVIGGEVSFTFHDPKRTMTGNSVGQLSGVWIDEDSHDVWVDAYKLTPPLRKKEYELVKLLNSVPDRVFSREEIIKALWPEDDPSGISKDAIDSVIKRLRSRLYENPQKKNYLLVLRGQGVKLKIPGNK